jgi:hypothetical protein
MKTKKQECNFSIWRKSLAETLAYVSKLDEKNMIILYLFIQYT